MKKFLLRFIRCMLYAITLLSISMACLIVYNGYNKLRIGQVLLLALLPMCLATISYFFATRTGKFNTTDECKIEFSDVTWMNRHHIVILCVGQLCLLFVTLACNFGNVFQYDTLYADAGNVIRNEYDGSETSLVIYKSLPSWYAERALIGAQSISKAEAVIDDTEMSSTEQATKVTDIANKMDSSYAGLKWNAFLGVTSLFMFSWLFMYSKRNQQYHTSMRKLEKVGN